MKAAIRSALLFSLSLTCMPLVLQAADDRKEFVGSEKCRSMDFAVIMSDSEPP